MFGEARSHPFFRQLDDRVRELGGSFNAHLHLDRSGTLADSYIEGTGRRILQDSHISLHEKHGLINSLHAGPAYDRDDLERRVNTCLDVMVAANTRRADTMVDVTADRVRLSALETLSDIKRQRADEIDLRVAAYSPLGFKDSDPERWEVFSEGAKKADFLGCLPEADDTDEYPDHIGFEEHCRRMLALTREQRCMLHVHTDQRNEPSEAGTERLVQVVREVGALERVEGEPAVWAIHVISPSTYDEDRFRRLLDGLLECDIGVICCPSAAIGMRQLRPVNTPTYNSIPRLLEMLVAQVPVRIASDNIADICSPSTTADLTDEVLVLSAALRYYDVEVLARVAAGQPLSSEERQRVSEHLRNNDAEIAKVLGDASSRHG